MVQEQEKEFFGSAYHDYGLVISQANGNPYDGRNLSTKFKRFTKAFKFRDVDFYSLRHSSATENFKPVMTFSESLTSPDWQATSSMPHGRMPNPLETTP